MINQVLVENYLCDSLLAFSPPRDLCRLVCILLWIKCLDALLMLGFLFGNVEIVDLRHENSTPSIKMRWNFQSLLFLWESLFCSKIELKHKNKTIQTDKSNGKGIVVMFKSLRMLSKL